MSGANIYIYILIYISEKSVAKKSVGEGSAGDKSVGEKCG